MRKLGAILGIAALVVIGGCIKANEEITLNKDGSGSCTLTYGMSEQSIQQLQAMAKQQEGGEMEMDMDAFEFDENKVKESFEALKDKGVTLKDVKAEVKDGWKYITVDFDFQSLNGLAESDTPLEGFSLSKDDSGNYVFMTGSGEAAEVTPEQAEEAKMMAGMFAGMRIQIRINVPTKVIETNAPVKGDSYAEWVWDIDKDPVALVKMENEGMKLVFDGTGVDIPAFQEVEEEEAGMVAVETSDNGDEMEEEGVEVEVEE